VFRLDSLLSFCSVNSSLASRSVPEDTLRRLRLVFDGIVRLDAPPSPTADPALQQLIEPGEVIDYRQFCAALALSASSILVERMFAIFDTFHVEALRYRAREQKDVVLILLTLHGRIKAQ
jgi:hypothetical protein